MGNTQTSGWFQGSESQEPRPNDEVGQVLASGSLKKVLGMQAAAAGKLDAVEWRPQALRRNGHVRTPEFPELCSSISCDLVLNLALSGKLLG